MASLVWRSKAVKFILRVRGTIIERVSVREIQPTPNPNALKFVLDGLIAEQPKSFFSVESAKEDPLAARLFEIPGVSSLLFLGDFITINKSPEARWADIRERVKRVLAKVEPAAKK